MMRCLLLLVVIFTVKICDAQKIDTNLIEKIDSWRGDYQSKEFAPLNNNLVYPTQSAGLSQRNNSVKPTKYEREILAIWKKVFDDHLSSLPQKIRPQTAQIYYDFKTSVDKVYSELLSNRFNYGQANSSLNNIALLLEQRISEEEIRQEKLDNQLREIQQKQFIDKTRSQNSAQINKVNCSDKKTQLESLRLQQETWDEMTASLNEGFKEPSERAKMEQVQKQQAIQNNQNILNIVNFIRQKCN